MDGGDVQRRNGNLSVLSVPIATCDRRALPEAWYSVLHKRRRPSEIGQADIPRNSVAPQPASRRLVEFIAHRKTVQAAKLVRAPSQRRRFICEEAAFSENARPSDLLAKRIERKFFSQSRPPMQATFTVQQGRTRVQVLLRRFGQRVHIVALCTVASRDVVGAALEQIRRRLEPHGMQLRSALTRELVP